MVAGTGWTDLDGDPTPDPARGAHGGTGRDNTLLAIEAAGAYGGHAGLMNMVVPPHHWLFIDVQYTARSHTVNVAAVNPIVHGHSEWGVSPAEQQGRSIRQIIEDEIGMRMGAAVSHKNTINGHETFLWHGQLLQGVGGVVASAAHYYEMQHITVEWRVGFAGMPQAFLHPVADGSGTIQFNHPSDAAFSGIGAPPTTSYQAPYTAAGLTIAATANPAGDRTSRFLLRAGRPGRALSLIHI